jgi:transcriptional regulator
MYIPKFFRVTNMNEVRDFIEKNSFATIVSNKQQRLIATHTPLQFFYQDGDAYITGHMAYGNPQWKTFQPDQEVLVIYQGPHAYISSSWYEHENVPTWNYQSVHIYGTASIMTREEVKQDLQSLLQKYEQHRENPVLWEKLSLPFLEKELKGIVGFKIAIKEIQAAYKLSQNRNEQDYQNIITQLMKEPDISSQQLAAIMKAQKK